MNDNSYFNSQPLPGQDSETLEVWEPVVGYEGVYEVSSIGRVQRVKTGRVLSPGHTKRGYLFVNLCENSETQVLSIHALVAAAFIGKRPDGYHINHIDGDKSNNRVSNLEYVTPKENVHHALKMGLMGLNLSDELIRRVYALLEQVQPKLTYAQISEMVGIQKGTVKLIARGELIQARLQGFEGVVKGTRTKKLTEADVEEIRGLIAEGILTQQEIAARFNVHNSLISHLKKGDYYDRTGQKRTKGVTK